MTGERYPEQRTAVTALDIDRRERAEQPVRIPRDERKERDMGVRPRSRSAVALGMLRGARRVSIIVALALAGTMTIATAASATDRPSGAVTPVDHVDCDLTAHTPTLNPIGPQFVYAEARGTMSCDRSGLLYIRVELQRNGGLLDEEDSLLDRTRTNSVVVQEIANGSGCQSYQAEAYACWGIECRGADIQHWNGRDASPTVTLCA